MLAALAYSPGKRAFDPDEVAALYPLNELGLHRTRWQFIGGTGVRLGGLAMATLKSRPAGVGGCPSYRDHRQW